MYSVHTCAFCMCIICECMCTCQYMYMYIIIIIMLAFCMCVWVSARVLGTITVLQVGLSATRMQCHNFVLPNTCMYATDMLQLSGKC